ncbi:MAG: DUF2206 domain-containing protein [Candidatus Bathyarchaeia archaeon]|jgi:uncharacterized membrane protein
MYFSLKAISLFSILTLFLIILNIPVVTPIVGFVFLTFIPGYLLLRLLKLDKKILETVIFSLGLSLSLNMFFGLAINQINATLNLSKIMSNIFLATVLFGLSFALIIACRFKEKNLSIPQSSISFNLKRNSLWIILAILIVIFGVVGAIEHSTWLTMAMILGVAALFFLAILMRKRCPNSIFPIIIAASSIALLFNTVLISRYLLGGSDVFSEFAVFKIAENQGFWQPPGQLLSYTLIDSLNSLLSITVLPLIYVNFLNISGDVLFKIFYPFVFAFVPLALYRMYSQQVDKRTAFLSVLFYISVPIAFFGLEPLSLDRQIIGQFFLILSIFLLVTKEISQNNKLILQIFFGAALIVSHYSIAFIFVIYLIFFYAITKLSQARFFLFKKTSMQSLSLAFVVLMVVMTFSWYIFVSNSAFNQLESVMGRISSLFVSDFGSAEARGFGPGALQSLSPVASTTFLGAINKILVYLENGLLAIGILAMVFMPSRFRLSSEFRMVVFVSSLFLLLGFAVPNLSLTLNMTRFYGILIPFLAPFVILGAYFISDLVQKRFLNNVQLFKGKIDFRHLVTLLMTCILIITLLFQTGLIGHVSDGYPYSYSLDLDRRLASEDSSIRIGTHTSYFLQTEVSGATWLQENVKNSTLYADDGAQTTILRSYAYLPEISYLPITFGFSPQSGSFAYLKVTNLELGVVGTAMGGYLNATEVLNGTRTCNVIYSNADSVIYYSP